MSNKRRLERIEQRLRIAPGADANTELARALCSFCETRELADIVKLLNAVPEDQETITDSRVLEILQRAAQRREQYGTVEAWQAATGGNDEH